MAKPMYKKPEYLIKADLKKSKCFFMLVSFFLFVFTSLCTTAKTFNCATVQEITEALETVSPGDEIIISPGTYTVDEAVNHGYFYSNINGTEAAPITIRSLDKENQAILKGTEYTKYAVLRIEGDHWIVRDLKLTNGQKGLTFDNSNYSKAINLEVYDTGNEAIHIRDGSDYVTIDSCRVHHTGLDDPGKGEGIYVGTDKGYWTSYDPYCWHTTIKHCVIGPQVQAEPIDIKEGTQETIIEFCTIDATGISLKNYADSFIDLKGIRAYVRYNTFTRNGETNLTKGIAVINRDIEMSGYEHVIYNNIFNMDISDGNIVEAYSSTSQVYAWNNVRIPTGRHFNSIRVQNTCCPDWFTNENPVKYSIAIQAQNGEVLPEAGFYEVNTQLTLTANPANGYRFVEWRGDVSGKKNQIALIVDCDKNITAIFETDPTDLKKIENTEHNQKFYVYPNPVTDGKLHLLSMKKTAITIYSVSGEKYYTGKASTLNVSNWPTGIYIIKMNNCIQKSIIIN